jgi:hypothetical protein
VGSEERRATDVADQLGVARLQELNDCPDSDVLEGSVGASQETVQVVVHAALRLVPDLVKCRVVVRSRSAIFGREISKGSSAIALDLGTRRVGEWDQNLTDPHFQQLTLEFI